VLPVPARADRTADIVVWSHSLNEIAPGREDRIGGRADLVSRSAELLSPRGILILQEPALLATSRDLLAVRDLVLRPGNLKALAPCFTDAPCPALAKGPGETCHMDFGWTPPPHVRALAARAGLDRDALKSTYVVLARADAEFRPLPGAAGDPYRVVSESMLNKGGKRRFFVCGREGRFTLSAKPALVPDRARAFLSLARGDVVTFSGTEERENGRGIVQGTALDAFPRG
jgi:hypothetical protein